MAETTEIQSATKDDQAAIDALCVRTLFERQHFAALVAPLGTLFLAWYEKDSVSLFLLAGWVALNSLPYAFTFWNTGRLLRHPPSTEKLRFWYKWQLVVAGLQGTSWGAATFFFNSPGEAGLFNDMVILMVIIAVTCISIINLAPSFQTFVVFIGGALFLPITHFIWLDHAQSIIYIVSIITLLVALLIFGWVSNREFVEGERRFLLIQKISKQLEQRNQQLDELNQELSSMAIHDKLTGLYNRHFIVDQLEIQFKSFQRYGSVCSIILVDVDFFKQVNDGYGHAVGDDVLIAFSRMVEGMLRKGDYIGRYGGEEFLLVLPMTYLSAAVQVAQRIRSELTSTPLLKQPVELFVTASFGVAQIRSNESIDDWLLRVDQALYRAKESGRNCVKE